MQKIGNKIKKYAVNFAFDLSEVLSLSCNTSKAVQYLGVLDLAHILLSGCKVKRFVRLAAAGSEGSARIP